MTTAIIFCVLFFLATGAALYWFVRMLKAEEELSARRREAWRTEDALQACLTATERMLEDTQRELRRLKRRNIDLWKESDHGREWLQKQKKSDPDVN